jgi:hypothetical protein
MSDIICRNVSSGQRMMYTIVNFQKEFSRLTDKKNKLDYLNNLNIHWPHTSNTDSLLPHSDENVFYDYFNPNIEELSNCLVTPYEPYEQIMDFWEDIQKQKFDEIDYGWVRSLFNPSEGVKHYLDRLISESNIDFKNSVMCYFRGWTEHSGPPTAGGNHPHAYTEVIDSMGLDNAVIMTDNYFWGEWFKEHFKKKYKILDLSPLLINGGEFRAVTVKKNAGDVLSLAHGNIYADKFNADIKDGIYIWYAKLLFISMFEHHILSSGSHTSYLISFFKNSIRNTVFIDWELNHNFYNVDDKNLKCKINRYNFSEGNI